MIVLSARSADLGMQRHHTDVIGLRAGERSCTVALLSQLSVGIFLSPNYNLKFLMVWVKVWVYPRYKNPRVLPFFSRHYRTNHTEVTDDYYVGEIRGPWECSDTTRLRAAEPIEC